MPSLIAREIIYKKYRINQSKLDYAHVELGGLPVKFFYLEIYILNTYQNFNYAVSVSRKKEALFLLKNKAFYISL